jgi:hypothetical protein
MWRSPISHDGLRGLDAVQLSVTVAGLGVAELRTLRAFLRRKNRGFDSSLTNRKSARGKTLKWTGPIICVHCRYQRSSFGRQDSTLRSDIRWRCSLDDVHHSSRK